MAAMECWTKAGYHGASLKDIATAAGVAKSLVHYHFASKDHLLIELQAEWCRMVARAVKSRIAEPDRTASVAQRRAAAMSALDQVWTAMVATRAQFGFAIEVWRQSETNPAIRRRLLAFDREIRELLESGLRATLGDDLALPIARVVTLVHVALDGFSLRLYLDDDDAAIRAAFDDWKAILFAALMPGGSR